MDVGETLRFKSDVTDATGALVNASAVTLTLGLPDGSTTVQNPTNPPITMGKYFHDYTPTLQGRYTGTWLFTFAGGNTASYAETFDVGASLVTVDEAVSHLRASGVVTSEADLEQLQWLCFVATDAVERDLGRIIVRRAVTETYDGGTGAIILRSTPVLSITTVVDGGVSVLASDYTLDASSGILYRGSTVYGSYFLRGRQSVVVTYVAGYLNPPPVVRKVALNAVQGMWQSSQQAPHSALDEAGEMIFTLVAALTPFEQRGYDSLRSAAVA